jgi:D-beta-D-heptose 7-phosphate kinase/D-beta-D-heptose 1-phosphate adenosyltransferase
MSHQELLEIVKEFPHKKILVIGDCMLDEFIWGGVSRISPEAPVPVVSVEKRTFSPGGAGNVAVNLERLGAEVFLSGVRGRDTTGQLLCKQLTKRKIHIQGLFCEPGRPTTLKTRIIAHNQQVVRVDTEKTHQINSNIQKQILEYYKKLLPKIDGIIIEDYNKGVVTPELLGELLAESPKLITVDPKGSYPEIYRGVTAITPNQSEAETMVGNKIVSGESLLNLGEQLLAEVECQCVLLTRGSEGMLLFEKDASVTQIPTRAREVYDVTGAGDTVISIFTLALSCGASFREAAELANFGAGVVVGKVGVSSVSPRELIRAINGK